MNVNELRDVISKIREYYVDIKNPSEFLSSLNKRQINNIIKFKYEKKYLKKTQIKTWLVNYCDVLKNKDLLDYSNFNEISDMIFNEINVILERISNIEVETKIKLNDVLLCKEAYKYGTIYEDLRIILGNLKKIETLKTEPKKEYEEKVRTIMKVHNNLINIASNPNSIPYPEHLEIMEMVMKADPEKGKAIAKVEKSKKVEDYLSEKIRNIIMNKPSSFSYSIVEFVTKSHNLDSDIYLYCLDGILKCDSLSNVNSMIQVCTSPCFKNYKNQKELIDIILNCNIEYLEILEDICLTTSVMEENNVIEKLKLFFKVNDLEEANKMSKIILGSALGWSPNYDEYDEILYNAYMYVDSEVDFEKELPKEVFKKINNK